MRAADTIAGRAAGRARRRFEIQGQVQGVGFRPFVFNLARELGLGGFVTNTGAGVLIEAEGPPTAIDAFLARLQEELPALARIDSCTAEDVPGDGHSDFTILDSDRGGAMESLVLPDIATCGACLRELHDPADRRYRYPFTNCTHCGPRYSIVEAMPYDRPYTTMAGFPLCPDCRHEYEDPADRRFHAQPVACPACGPRLALWAADGTGLADDGQALAGAIEALRAGRIVAMKGLGGFQLLADARNGQSVAMLRARKRREAKPFALMFPTLDGIREVAAVEPAHAALLQSPEAPIVLTPARPEGAELVASIAPDTYQLGIMLPYAPLHHLLLEDFGGPLVVTSGNLGEEPLCIDEFEALQRLRGIADLFLVHNRPIARQVDDSIATVVDGRPMLLRRARGYAPAPLATNTDSSDVLAAGAHLKNSITFTKAGRIFPSQHIGNLENLPAMEALQKTTTSMKHLFEMAPLRAVHDLHPDYASTRFATDQGVPARAVQHHFAHVLSCMAEHGLTGPVLGVSWDGTGYGTDGTIWGGEFLRCTREGFERVGSLRPFRLPGGDAAVRDGWRSAISLLREVQEDDPVDLAGLPALAAVPAHERRVVEQMLSRQFNAPVTTSMGRLFDAVASLCGLCQHSAFEGQAAMRLERAAVLYTAEAAPIVFPAEPYEGRLVLDWRPAIAQILALVGAGTPAGAIAQGFHQGLADGILKVAAATGLSDIVLTGGCFQNKRLLELSLDALRTQSRNVYWHRAVPPNDGGISVGQAWFQPAGDRTPCV